MGVFQASDTDTVASDIRLQDSKRNSRRGLRRDAPAEFRNHRAPGCIARPPNVRGRFYRHAAITHRRRLQDTETIMMWDEIPRDEKINTIRDMVADGLSANQMAAKMNAPSRSAIIGLMSRAGIKSRRSPNGRGKAKSPWLMKPYADRAAEVSKLLNGGYTHAQIAAKTGAPSRQAIGTIVKRAGLSAPRTKAEPSSAAPRLPIPMQLDENAPESLRCDLVNLPPRGCKWPINDGDPFLFCGADRHELQPYCGYHVRLSCQRYRQDS